MLEAYIYDGLRTPFGRHAGALSRVRPDDLLAGVVKEVVARSGFAPEIDRRRVGRLRHPRPARTAATSPATRCCWRACRSRRPAPCTTACAARASTRSIGAAHAITCGEADVCVAGGVESMTRAPFVVGKAEQAFAKDFKVFNSSLGARFPNPKIESLFGADTMPQTADNLARDYQLTREECDLFALGSQQKYAKAGKDGFFKSEIQARLDRRRPRASPTWSSARTSIRAPRRPWRPCRSSSRCSPTA